jgi:hypothetical protein
VWGGVRSPLASSPKGGQKGSKIDMEMKTFDFLMSVMFKLLNPIRGSSGKKYYFFTFIMSDRGSRGMVVLPC